MTERLGEAKNPVSANQAVGELNQVISEIEANIRDCAVENHYTGDEAEELISYMRARVMILVGGLLPADDYSELSKRIDNLVGSAREVTRNATRLETCERAVRLSLDGVQENLIKDGMLSDLALNEINRRRSSEERN